MNPDDVVDVTSVDGDAQITPDGGYVLLGVSVSRSLPARRGGADGACMGALTPSQAREVARALNDAADAAEK